MLKNLLIQKRMQSFKNILALPFCCNEIATSKVSLTRKYTTYHLYQFFEASACYEQFYRPLNITSLKHVRFLLKVDIIHQPIVSIIFIAVKLKNLTSSVKCIVFSLISVNCTCVMYKYAVIVSLNNTSELACACLQKCRKKKQNLICSHVSINFFV